MGACRENLARALLFQFFGRLYQRTAAVDDVVDQNGDLAFDVADDVHDLGLAWSGPPLVYDRQAGVFVDLLGHVTRPFGATRIWRDNHDVAVFDLLLDLLLEDQDGIEVVDRDVEEALNLVRVQVNGDQTIRARDHEQVCH